MSMRIMLCSPTWMRAVLKTQAPKLRVPKTWVCSARSVPMWSASETRM